MPENQDKVVRNDSATGAAFVPIGDLVHAAASYAAAWQQQDAACAGFARGFADRRVLLGLLALPGAQRMAAARARGAAVKVGLSDAALHGLVARRTIIGLMRRPRAAAEAIVREIMRRLLDAERQTQTTTIRQALGNAGIGRPELFYDGGPASADAPAVFSMIDRLRRAGWGTTGRPLPDYLAEQLAHCHSFGHLDAAMAMAWVGQVVHGWTLFPNAPSLLVAASHIRHSPLFDAHAYARRAGIACDENSAALHYALIGDALGIAPSAAFDPAYYAERNRDVLAAGSHRLLHYIHHGQHEGRRGISNVPFHITRNRMDGARGNVILVVHETSRTGAPVLGWNIAKWLAERYNLFVVLLGGGPLTDDFVALSAACIGPCEHHGLHPADLEYALRPVLDQHEFEYAIVNSCESRIMLEPCLKRLVPTLLLMHEFGSYVYARDALRDAFDMASEVVFPARLVAQSSLEMHPPLRARPLRILPQGMSVMPGSATAPMAAPPGLQHVAAARLAGAFVVLGAGTVTFRKGVDLFLAVAMAVCRAALAPIHFVWIGRGYLPDEDMTYSIYLREQVERSGLTGRVTFVDELPDLEPAYALADAFLLASRLDPLPNVSIDAALRGIPIVCFQGASGMAEILSADPATEACVVGHLDIAAASGAILGLAADDALRQRMASATLSLGRSVFDMNAYCAALDTLGRDASGRFAQLRQDADMLCRTGGAGEETTGVPPAFDTPRQNARRQIARRRLLDARSEWCSAADAGTAAAPSGLPVMLA